MFQILVKCILLLSVTYCSLGDFYAIENTFPSEMIEKYDCTRQGEPDYPSPQGFVPIKKVSYYCRGLYPSTISYAIPANGTCRCIDPVEETVMSPSLYKPLSIPKRFVYEHRKINDTSLTTVRTIVAYKCVARTSISTTCQN